MCGWSRPEEGAVFNNDIWVIIGKAITAKVKLVGKRGIHRDFCNQKDLSDFIPILV